MKKLHFFGLLALTLVLALGTAFVACSSGSDDDGADNSFIPINGIINGLDVEAIISKTSKAAYNIATGDYYVIRFIESGDVISRGTIEWNDPMVKFIPEGGGDPFYGYYSAGDLWIQGVPFEGGFYDINKPVGNGASKNFPSLGAGSPWSNFKDSQSIIEDAFSAAFKALKEQHKDDTSPVYTDAMAYADAAASKEVQDLIKEFETLLKENMGAQSFKKQWATANADAITTTYPQESWPEYNNSFVYYLEAETGTGINVAPPTDSGWVYNAASTATLPFTSGRQTIIYTYEAIDDGLSGYLISVDYTVEFFPVAVFNVVWEKETTMGGELKVHYPDIYDASNINGFTDTLKYGDKKSQTYAALTGATVDITITGVGLGFYVSETGPTIANTGDIIHGTAVTGPPISGTGVNTPFNSGSPVASQNYYIWVVKM